MQEPLIPQGIGIETLNHCNAKCVMCPVTTTSRVRGTMSDATFNKIVEQILALPVKPARVSLHGTGEPLLYKKLGERIRALTRHGIPVYLTTNGSLMTRPRCFEVIDAGPTEIEFSIESLSKEVYEKIRIGLDLDDVLANFLSCVELRNKLNPAIRIAMAFVLHDENEDTLPAYEKFFEDHLSPGDQITIVPRHNYAGNFASHYLPTNMPCSFLTSAMNIQYEGVVNLCCADTEQTQALGDVAKNTLMEIFNNDKFNEIRRAHAEGRRQSIPICASCNLPEAIASYRRRTIPNPVAPVDVTPSPAAAKAPSALARIAAGCSTAIHSLRRR